MPEEEKAKHKVPFMKSSRFKELMQLFSKEFPEVFACKETKLMKIGIHEDISKKVDIDMSEIRGFLRMYCTGGKYLAAHTQGAKRHDLEGKELEEITQEQIDSVGKMIKARSRKRRIYKEQQPDLKKAS